MNYELFRILVEESRISHVLPGRSVSHAKVFEHCLIDPGADLVIWNEGHLLKNDKTSLNSILNDVRTKRRVALTGTPLQNKLEEYYFMVNFVKPHLLGTLTEYRNRFVHPITNGQYQNSSEEDIHMMKTRSHILHKLLSGCVQRLDLTVLEQMLPTKLEYVLHIQLTPLQIDLYTVRYFSYIFPFIFL